MADEAIDPTRLTPEQLARLLKSAGWADATTEKVEADVDAGCPTGEGGRISFIVYTAWLLENRVG